MTGTSRALFGGYVLLVALAAPVALSAAQDGETEAPATSGGAVTAPPASEGEAAASEPEAAAATSAAKQAAHEVLMRDIEFVPKTITVDVGDTVTWRNEDSEPHNAIANDNSVFSTETIQQGETVSATIDQAGTIPYFCSIHAGMKGTVRALGGGSGGGGSGGGSGGFGSPGGSSDDFLDPSATPPAGSGSAAGSSSSAGGDAGLPVTGSDSIWLALAGAWLLSVGAAIRAAVSGASR